MTTASTTAACYRVRAKAHGTCRAARRPSPNYRAARRSRLPCDCHLDRLSTRTSEDPAARIDTGTASAARSWHRIDPDNRHVPTCRLSIQRWQAGR